jgi:hypothetical protein
MIESDRGQMRFGSPFVFSFPTMTVITLTTTAPGYQPRQEVMKPHALAPVPCGACTVYTATVVQ